MSLKDALAKSGQAVVAPGCYDALTASLIADAGFSAAYLSGASIAYTRLGGPDIGLTTATEVADTVALIRDRNPGLSLIVDGDTGFGNALNVQRTVRSFERAGAAAIQLEDQVLPKRCGHLAGKRLVSGDEMVGKIKAALDVRQSDQTLIIARTDAIGVDGIDAAMERAGRYVEAGADVLFIEAPRDLEQMKRICGAYAGRIPMLANMVEGGDTPISKAQDLADLGYRLVIFPGAAVRVLVWTLQRFYADLKTNGSSDAWRDRMLDFKGLNAVIGTEAILEAGRKYDEDINAAGMPK